MPRTFQLLLCTLLLTLFGASEASALLSQNHAGNEWTSTQKYRVMGYAEKAPGRLAFLPQLRLQLAMGCEGYGYENASGQGNYCNGDPVNGLDPDGRVGVGANVENDLNSIDSAVNQSSLDQVHDSLDGAITSDDIADAVGGLASGYDQLLGGSGNPVNDAGSSVGSYLDNTVQTGQQSWTVATSSQTTFGQKLEGGAVFAANGVLFGMNLVPGEGEIDNAVVGDVGRNFAAEEPSLFQTMGQWRQTSGGSIPNPFSRVQQSNIVGNAWDDYVQATKLSGLDNLGQLETQEAVLTNLGYEVVPDYTISNANSEVVAYADAKSGAIAFDNQARGFVQIATTTPSQTFIYYVPKPIQLPSALVNYANQYKVTLKTIVVP